MFDQRFLVPKRSYTLMSRFSDVSCCYCFVLLAALRYVSILSKAADISLNIGDLATVDAADAVGFMGGINMDKSKWLQFDNTSIHPEALLRFLVLGAPREGVFPNSSWGPQEEENIKNMGGLLATRNASIAQSTFEQAVQDLGVLHVDAWMLGFMCVDSESPCLSLAPAALVKRTNHTSNYACLELTAVWNKLLGSSTDIVVNALPAKLIRAAKTIIKPDIEGPQLDKFSLNVLSKPEMEACASTEMQVAVSSSLDTTYNVGPYACYHVMDSQFSNITGSESLLVLGMPNTTTSSSQFSGVGEVGYHVFVPTLYDFQQCLNIWLQNSSQPVNGERCKEASHLYMFSSTDDPDTRDEAVACRFNQGSSTSYCSSDMGSETSEPDKCKDTVLAAFQNASILASMSLQLSGVRYIRGGGSYGVIPTDNLCEGAVGILINGSTHPSNGLGADAYESAGCNGNNPVAVDAEVLGLSLTGLNSRYAQAHSDAFQLANGAPTDFYTAVISFIGAAISVLAATIPFTNFLLRLLVKLSATFLDGPALSRYFKMAALSLLNVVLALVCYGAVVGTIESEIQRSTEFKTWGIIAESLDVNAMGLQIQVLFVVHGTSVYKSRLLGFIYILLTSMVVLVGGMTFCRCYDVWRRLELIMAKRISESVITSTHIGVQMLDKYRAIDMSASEHMMMKQWLDDQLAPSVGVQDLAAMSLLIKETPQKDHYQGQGVADVVGKFKKAGLLAISVEKFKSHANQGKNKIESAKDIRV